MFRSRAAGLLAISIGFGSSADAQLAPPVVRSWRPIGAAAGERVALEVIGAEIGERSTIRFDDPTVLVEEIKLGGEGASRTLRATVRIPDEAAPGPLRFRVVGAGGISNPGTILIGRAIPTVLEVEPNNRLARPQPITGPAAIEGTIAPGDDVDVFGVDMKAGETLVAEAIASRASSRLDPYLTILSPDGRELAANDDRFGRDAATWATVPADGRYRVLIQDAEGRHRDGGIESKMTRPYRLEVGRITLVSGLIPAGARRGQATTLQLRGVNLPEGGRVRFEPATDSPIGERLVAFGGSNPFAIRVGDLAENLEPGPNDRPDGAPTVTVPAAIDGTLSPPDGAGVDVDFFRLKAEPGREGDYAITAYAARIGSPTDPILASFDAKGGPQIEDDDKLGRDARIERLIDAKDGLVISVRDYYGRGGSRFTYRIEVEPVARGVAVSAGLGHRTLPRSGALLVPVSVEREGYQGAMTLVAEGLPDGINAPPIVMEPDESKGLLAMTAGAEAALGPFAMRLAVREVPATFHFNERGPIDEVPREGDQNRGPRETTVGTGEPMLAVVDRVGVSLNPPVGPIAARKGDRAEVTFAIARGDDRPRKLKVRLMGAGKALERFEPIGVLELPAGGSTARFVLKPKPDARPGEVAIAAHAWFDGSPELLGVDSPTVVVKVE